MKYSRPTGASQGDREAAREWEAEVGTWLGDYKIAHLESTEKMDYWVPGVFLDAKEKRQPISNKWPLPVGVAEQDVFILDELSIRKAMLHHPHAYFLLRDKPLDRVFLARLDEVLLGERVRVDRVGPTGHAKGKHLLNLTQFRQLADPSTELLPAILADQVATPWKQSGLIHKTDL